MNFRKIPFFPEAEVFGPLSRAARQARAWLVRNISETHFLIILAVIIGLGGGLGAVGFRWLIGAFRELFLVKGAALLGHRYLLPLIPAAGGLLVGILVLRWAREARGHGVPEVMAAVATEDGRIRPRVAIIKSLASALCIGSGGSVGREGPIVQIGSALGSTIGQLFGLNDQRLKILVGCGAAAGIAATFNAPIAGVIFALEVILGDFTITAFSPIIISSVLATALARSVLGNEPAFIVPMYQTFSPYELGYYAILAVLGGAAAVGFTRILYWMEDRFDDWTISEYAKPVIGGLLVGGIGIYFPQVFGVGYEAITDVVHNRTGLGLILILFVAKFLATSFTLGSGGSGGIFAPSLFLGATLGGIFGNAVHALTPGVATEPGAYALVGMAVFVAGTTHAPLTAMLILFELTDDYKIILPLMLATTISTLIAKWLYAESIYTLKLSRRGLHISQGIDLSVLQSIHVRDILSPDFPSVSMNTSLGDVVHLLEEDGYTDFPVVDNGGDLRGVVSFHDIRPVMMRGELHPLLLAVDMMREDAPAVTSDASLLEALNLFSQSDIHNLPVVEDTPQKRLVGMITRSALMERYDQEIRKQMNRCNSSRNGNGKSRRS